MKPDQTINGEKEQDPEVGGDAPEATEPSPAADAEDYPTGATLALIVVALAMSMFLVALDMVRNNMQLRALISLPLRQIRIVGLTFAPNLSRRQSSQRPSQRSLTSSTASRISPGTARPSSSRAAASSHRGARPSSTSSSRLLTSLPSLFLSSAVLFAVWRLHRQPWLLDVLSLVLVLPVSALVPIY